MPRATRDSTPATTSSPPVNAPAQASERDCAQAQLLLNELAVEQELVAQVTRALALLEKCSS